MLIRSMAAARTFKRRVEAQVCIYVLVYWCTDAGTACLPACLPACLFACLPACLPACLCSLAG